MERKKGGGGNGIKISHYSGLFVRVKSRDLLKLVLFDFELKKSKHLFLKIL